MFTRVPPHLSTPTVYVIHLRAHLMAQKSSAQWRSLLPRGESTCSLLVALARRAIERVTDVSVRAAMVGRGSWLIILRSTSASCAARRAHASLSTCASFCAQPKHENVSEGIALGFRIWTFF